MKTALGNPLTRYLILILLLISLAGAGVSYYLFTIYKRSIASSAELRVSLEHEKEQVDRLRESLIERDAILEETLNEKEKLKESEDAKSAALSKALRQLEGMDAECATRPVPSSVVRLLSD